MTPYYSCEYGDLYHGDCREVLPALPKECARMLLTDPPYGVAWQGRRRTNDTQFAVMAGDKEGELDVPACLSLALLKLTRRGHVYIFGKFDLRGLRLTESAELIWDKVNMGLGDLTKPFGTQHETITFATWEHSPAGGKGDGRLVARMRRGSVLRCQRPNSIAVKRHPTEKPVDLLRQLIESSSCLGDTVLDPFAGSGSTLVAAALEGRRFIGIEIEQKFCDVIVDRLEAVVVGHEPGKKGPARAGFDW